MRCFSRPGSPASLAELTRAPDYASGIAAVVREMNAARDQAAAVDLLQEATLRMGAEVSVFVSFIPDDGHRSYRVLLGCDPAWLIEYEHHVRYADDPWLTYAQGVW